MTTLLYFTPELDPFFSRVLTGAQVNVALSPGRRSQTCCSRLNFIQRFRSFLEKCDFIRTVHYLCATEKIKRLPRIHICITGPLMSRSLNLRLCLDHILRRLTTRAGKRWGHRTCTEGKKVQLEKSSSSPEQRTDVRNVLLFYLPQMCWRSLLYYSC